MTATISHTVDRNVDLTPAAEKIHPWVVRAEAAGAFRIDLQQSDRAFAKGTPEVLLGARMIDAHGHEVAVGDWDALDLDRLEGFAAALTAVVAEAKRAHFPELTT